eukprot:CAMPEP_0169088590 /NCGR_PEP_ID=MMETSP1015-20121227/14834_1 /TAXON_ID=342587 /ORGANISM="Karlodinium micrum, Strain CCMP2283" /LENGTH=61 /DNA_ID=CAMNT_0009148873 /DNA_START=234 /DNA_END=419 /DNA_ORIENTATION=+
MSQSSPASVYWDSPASLVASPFVHRSDVVQGRREQEEPQSSCPFQHAPSRSPPLPLVTVSM